MALSCKLSTLLMLFLSVGLSSASDLSSFSLQCPPRDPLYYRCSIIPEPLQHGSMEEFVGPYGRKALLFTCDAGFALTGSPIATCNCVRDFWYKPFPICVPKDCLTFYDGGIRESGIYGIKPDGAGTIYPYCDMDNGGWTVIQRRVDGSVNFNRDWQSYKEGFGNPKGNYWIGLDQLHRLTKDRVQLYVSLKAGHTEEAFATYDYFTVSDEEHGYQLRVVGYAGTAGDAMKNHDQMKFSTYDVDNDLSDTNCAFKYPGGWWYNNCYKVNLNGVYGMSESIGIIWSYFKSSSSSLSFVEMKIRRI